MGNVDQAIEWCTEAAGAGIRDAKFNLGNHYSERGDLEHAIRWYKAAAEAGGDDALPIIAGHYILQSDNES